MWRTFLNGCPCVQWLPVYNVSSVCPRAHVAYGISRWVKTEHSFTQGYPSVENFFNGRKSSGAFPVYSIPDLHDLPLLTGHVRLHLTVDEVQLSHGCDHKPGAVGVRIWCPLSQLNKSLQTSPSFTSHLQTLVEHEFAFLPLGLVFNGIFWYLTLRWSTFIWQTEAKEHPFIPITANQVSGCELLDMSMNFSDATLTKGTFCSAPFLPSSPSPANTNWASTVGRSGIWS